VNFSTYEGVTAEGKNGELVYWRMVARAVDSDSMPKGKDPLSPENKDLILSWAEQDAPENCE